MAQFLPLSEGHPYPYRWREGIRLSGVDCVSGFLWESPEQLQPTVFQTFALISPEIFQVPLFRFHALAVWVNEALSQGCVSMKFSLRVWAFCC